MQYDNYDKFSDKIGMITDESELIKLGITSDNDGRFYPNELEKLKEFVSSNKGYHIATETSDSEGSDVEGAVCTTISNYIRVVNREYFVLCNGDDNPDIYLDEIDYY